MALSRLDEDGSTRIPSDVLKHLGIKGTCYLRWSYDETRRVLVAQVVRGPLELLKGRYRDEELVYDKVEEKADELLEGFAGCR